VDRTELPNKGMKLTKPEHFGASQLIPGVLRASWCQFGKGSRATDVLLRTTGHGRQATDAATTRWRRKTATDEAATDKAGVECQAWAGAP
jgi:hypothetical protein